MAEIATTDLSAATLTRFVNIEAAQSAIDAVLVAARGHCGWHVSPVREDDELVLDGPGVSVLDLPTGKLNALTEVVEGSTELEVDKLDWSETGAVRKQSGTTWSRRYRSVEVVIDHGYTEEEAADWRKAIVDMVNIVSYSASTSDDGLKRKKVDDVEYEWFDFASAAGDAVYSASAVLDKYQLPEVLFV